MDNAKSFQCPNCGSPIATSGADREVKCAYCGSSVIVPQELLDQTPPPQMHHTPMSAGNDEVLETMSSVGKAAAGITVGVTAASLILPVALTCIILAAVGGILYVIFSNTTSAINGSSLPTNVSALVTQAPADTATPPPTPFDTPMPFTKVLLKDNFTNSSSGWDKMHDSNYTLEYKNGAYHVFIGEQGKGQIVWRTESFTDESIDVDIQQTAGPSDGKLGVACRASDSGGLYSFEFSKDGSYGIYKYTDWNSDMLDGGTLDPGTLNQGQVNHLEAVCAGENLTMLLNGKPILQVQDSQYTSGGVGMVVRTGGSGDPGIDMTFSHLLVKGP